MSKERFWTVNMFRDLLKAYLTEPEFAQRVDFAQHGSERTKLMTVRLDDGSIFDIQITDRSLRPI